MGGRGAGSISAGGRGPGYSQGTVFAQRAYAQGDINRAEAIMNQRYRELQTRISRWQSGQGVSTAQAQSAMDEQNAIRDEMWSRGRAIPRR